MSGKDGMTRTKTAEGQWQQMQEQLETMQAQMAVMKETLELYKAERDELRMLVQTEGLRKEAGVRGARLQQVKNMTIANFSVAVRSTEAWLKVFEKQCGMFGVSPEDAFMFKCEPMELQLVMGSAASWMELKAAILRRWSTSPGKLEAIKQVQKFEQGEDESVGAAALRFETLVIDAQEDVNRVAHFFQSGLRAGIRRLLGTFQSDVYDRVLEEARRAEALDGSAAMSVRRVGSVESLDEPAMVSLRRVGKAVQCFHCKKWGHKKFKCPERRRSIRRTGNYEDLGDYDEDSSLEKMNIRRVAVRGDWASGRKVKQPAGFPLGEEMAEKKTATEDLQAKDERQRIAGKHGGSTYNVKKNASMDKSETVSSLQRGDEVSNKELDKKQEGSTRIGTFVPGRGDVIELLNLKNGRR